MLLSYIIYKLLFRITTLISDLAKLTYADFACPAFSLTGGTIGTFETSLTMDVSKTGKTPVAATLRSYGHPGSYLPVISLQDNTLYFVIFRAIASQRSISANDISARVYYN